MKIGHAEKVWLALIGLTFIGAALGETGHASWLLTMTVVILIALKGGIVIDYYMEMRSANQKMRNAVRLFIVLIPILVIVVHGWGDEVRQLTTLD